MLEFKGLFLQFVHKMYCFCASRLYLPSIYSNIYIYILFWKTDIRKQICYNITLMWYVIYFLFTPVFLLYGYMLAKYAATNTTVQYIITEIEK